ncbi:MAG: DUF1501 domain-containing protein [Planctomycetota bacterium]|jgi:hypothetical protein|nr:MAG: DUF1501 domain-containing protein [Planctomycetota bacterium]
MLTLLDSHPRYGRREMLRIGASGLAGLGAANWLTHPVAASPKGLPITNKSVILLFLHGGPSQIETFDPKMNAPVGIQSATGEIQTTLPGVTFGSSFPQLSQRADQFNIVRSFVTGDGNHDIKPVVCKETSGANVGSLYARVAGVNRVGTGMPTSAMLFPQSVDATTGPAITSFGKFESTGLLGNGYAPFVPGSGGDLQQNLELKVSVDRLGDRRTLLSELDRQRFRLDARGLLESIDPLQAQAFSTLLGGVAGAFDLSKEDQRTIARYDTAPLVRPDQINRKWNNYNHYVDNAKSLGKLLLLARRLCEAGCGFVTVTTSFVWDMHADVNNATVEEGMRYMGPPLDHAIAAFLDDVQGRGLSDRILFVATGEMGRTPRINQNGGRDHWGNLAPLLIAGGGLKSGQVIGQSSRDAGEPSSEPIRIQNLVSTMLQTLIDPSELRLMPGIPREIITAANLPPISGV